VGNGNSSLRTKFFRRTSAGSIFNSAARMSTMRSMVCRFGAAGAAVRIGRHAVGEHADDLGVDVLEAVQARHHENGERRDGRRQQLVIRAEVLDELHLHAEDGAVAVGGEFEIVDVAAAVGGAGEILTARFDPLDGLAELHRDKAHQSFFGVDIQLTPNPPPTSGRRRAVCVPGTPSISATKVRSKCGI
jgi:hypothetical protein